MFATRQKAMIGRTQQKLRQLASKKTEAQCTPYVPLLVRTMTRSSLLIVFLFLCGLAAAQQSQVNDKTTGQAGSTTSPASATRAGERSPDAPAGSNPPQASTPAPPGDKTSAPAPTTVRPSSVANEEAGTDPFLDTPPLPNSPVTLIGGTVRSVDHIRDHMTVVPFGGKPIKMNFDERTHIYRDGIETTFMGINKGDRVYVDTQLDLVKRDVFARNVHVITEMHAADAKGQIIAVGGGNITLRDELSGQPVDFRIDSTTKVKGKKGAGSEADLVPGALVALQFAPGKSNQRVLTEVSIIAKPGDIFRFFGQVTHLDLSRGVLAVRNLADDQTYEISFDPAVSSATSLLKIGTQVVVNASFNGRGYRASDISVTQARVAQPQ